MITTRHLPAMILSIAVACGGSPPPYQERTLPSGQTVKVLGVKDFEDLSPIRKILKSWATELLKNARIEFGVKP